MYVACEHEEGVKSTCLLVPYAVLSKSRMRVRMGEDQYVCRSQRTSLKQVRPPRIVETGGGIGVSFI